MSDRDSTATELRERPGGCRPPKPEWIWSSSLHSLVIRHLDPSGTCTIKRPAASFRGDRHAVLAYFTREDRGPTNRRGLNNYQYFVPN